MQPHLRGTGTLPTGEAAPPTTATPAPQGAATTTAPSTPVLPGVVEAEAFGAAVLAAGPGPGVPLDPRLAVVVTEVQRRIVADAVGVQRDAAILAQFERLSRKVSEVLHEFVGLRTVLGASQSNALGAAQVATKAQRSAQRAEALAEGALAAAVSERGSSPALQVDQLLAAAEGAPADLTTTVSDRSGQLRREARAPEPPSAPPAPKLAPGLSLPPSRQPATSDELVSVEQRVDRLEHQMGVAGRGDGWTKRRIALLGVLLFVGSFFGRIAFEWATRPAPSSPAAIVRPATSGDR